jgi:acetyl esterase/lipase
MAPQEQPSTTQIDDKKYGNTTRVLHTDDGAPYVLCDSLEAFRNPTTPPGMTHEDITEQLNLDLGQTLITRKNKTLLWMIQLLDRCLFEWWEVLFFRLWPLVPLVLRRALTFGAWKVYLQWHKLLLGRSTGLHPSQSQEYHALTTIMWWTRFFPITPRRMRFSLSQLHAVTPNIVRARRVEHIEEQVMMDDDNNNNDNNIPLVQKDFTTVRGMFLHQADDDKPTDHCLFWVYGGAYLAGDTLGSSSSADFVAQHCGMDVFLPQFRLAPEGTLDDVLWDICLAYQWLVRSRSRRNNNTGDNASKIIILGVSSGAAICVRLMQIIAEQQRDEIILPPYLPNMVGQMPKAAVLLGPYIDYTEPKEGSFLHYPRLDLIVNESVQDYGLPYLEEFIPEGCRRDYSPVYRSMEGLPPMCVVVSEHEAVYDQTIAMVNRARAQGVPVTVGVWKYMCHVFTLLWGFAPEGQLSMDFVCQWIVEQQQQQADSD